MRTAIVSDLHLGTRSGADLLRRDRFREILCGELEDADRVVVLGDLLELRDRPLNEALAAAEPVLGALGRALANRELIIVAGNHDHHLIEPWLERRRLQGAEPLGLEQLGDPEGIPFETLAAVATPAKVSFAYPGLWVRPDVYATHGHYLDRHLTVPTFERLGVALFERVLGSAVGSTAPRDGAEPIEEYERVQAPLYAMLFGLAQGSRAGGRGGADPSARLWGMVGGGAARSSRIRGWLLGAVAVPGAVGVANRLGLGPVRADLSSAAVGRAGFEAMAEVARRLRIRAEHVIFGHTHRRGTQPDGLHSPARLWNAGNWVHAPGLLGASARRSRYWPGTVAIVDDHGPPTLRHLLDDCSREELAGEP